MKCSISASRSPSERLFSKAGQIVSSQRAQLKPEQANMLIFQTCSNKIPKYQYYRYFFYISISVFFQYRNSLLSIILERCKMLQGINVALYYKAANKHLASFLVGHEFGACISLYITGWWNKFTFVFVINIEI